MNTIHKPYLSTQTRRWASPKLRYGKLKTHSPQIFVVFHENSYYNTIMVLFCLVYQQIFKPKFPIDINCVIFFSKYLEKIIGARSPNHFWQKNTIIVWVSYENNFKNVELLLYIWFWYFNPKNTIVWLSIGNYFLIFKQCM